MKQQKEDFALSETFLDYLRYERNASPRTVEEYRDDLMAFELFFKDLDNTLTWQTVDADVIREWILSMMGRGNKATTVNRRLSALRSCYKHLLRRGLVERDPANSVTAPRKEQPLPAFVREDEMDRLLDTEGMFKDNFEGRRNHLIVAMLYEAGFRLGELVRLDLKDVNIDARSVKVTGKGNKQRIVPFGEELLHLIYIYMEKRAALVAGRQSDEQAFFVTRKGTRIGADAVRVMIKGKLGMVTTQRKRSPHVLRHTFATSMLNHGANLESVKELLGHEKLSTTEIYTHTTFEELKKVYNEAHPRA